MASQDIGGVVNPRLKVYGIDNVRVVDAGVFPITTSSALQQTVYVIAEKVSLARDQTHSMKLTPCRTLS